MKAIGLALCFLVIGTPLGLLLFALLYSGRTRSPATPEPPAPDPDAQQSARGFALCLDANRIWRGAHVTVDKSGARVVAEGGSVLLHAPSLEALEALVWKRLGDA